MQSPDNQSVTSTQKLERKVIGRFCCRKWSLVVRRDLRLSGHRRCGRSRGNSWSRHWCRCRCGCRSGCRSSITGRSSAIPGTGVATGLRSGGRCITTLVCTLLLFSIRALAKKLNGISNYLCSVALCTGLVCPLTGAEFAFNIHLTAFVDVFFHDIGIIAPYNYTMPLSVFTQFSVTVTEALCGGKAEGCNLCVGCRILGIGFKVTDFGIISNVTDKHNFVQCHSDNNLLIAIYE